MVNIIYIFLFGCIGSRIAISMIAKYIDINHLPFMAIFTSMISLGFLRGFILNSPKIGRFGNVVWWQNYRIVHSINFGIFSILAVNKNPHAWIILFADAMLGLMFFTKKYLF
tara:strand:- start:6005 stop:6340 length:336 start_codon:yes stop_codon:yes gene_type:complete